MNVGAKTHMPSSEEFFNIFSTTVNDKYEAIIKQYKTLRESQQDAFEGEVLQWFKCKLYFIRDAGVVD